MPDYRLYGLLVRADCALPSLHPLAPAVRACDVRVELDGAPPAEASWRSAPLHYEGPPAPNGVPSVEVRRLADVGFWFRYPDGTEFTVDRAATRISATWEAHSTLEDTATYLLGPVLGFALRLRGVLALHASAAVIDGRAVAMVGESGAGKSTLAAALGAAGVPVLADDVLALRPDAQTPAAPAAGEAVMPWTAYASYPLLRLWPDAARLLFGADDAVPLITPNWDKRGLPLGVERPFHAGEAPLGTLLLLGARRDDDRAPYVEDVPPAEALMELVMTTYANYLLDDAMRAEELRALGALLRGRRVRRIVPHADASRMHAMVDLVRAVAEQS